MNNFLLLLTFSIIVASAKLQLSTKTAPLAREVAKVQRAFGK